MPLAALELARARDRTTALLERLGLSQYLFEIEPGEGDWQVRVECDADASWNSLTIRVDKQRLLASEHDSALFEQIAEEWQTRLNECRLQPE